MDLPAREAAMAANLTDTTLNFHAFMEFFTSTWQGNIIVGFIAVCFASIVVLAKMEENAKVRVTK